MEQLANNPVTTLNGAINNSVTSLTVTDASSFPTSGDFTIKIDTELLRVTAVSSNTFTVTRAQESTAAASHSDLAAVTLVITANSLNRLFAEMHQVGGYSSRPSAVRGGTTYRASDIDLAWLYNGSNWDLSHPLYVPYSKRVDISGWTSLNLGTTTWTNYNGVQVVTVPAESSLKVHGYYHAKPTAPFTLNVILPCVPIGQSDVLYSIFMRDSSSGKIKTFGVYSKNSFNGIEVTNWTDANTMSSDLVQVDMNNDPYIWLRIEDDNTNWRYYFSNDGVTYTRVYTETRNTFVTAPDVVGIGVTRNNTTPNVDLFGTFYSYWEA
jgi:hypothetical protein